MNTKQNSKPAAKDLSDAALIDILLTVDGQGKQAKAAALSELLKRTYDEGWNEGDAQHLFDHG